MRLNPAPVLSALTLTGVLLLAGCSDGEVDSGAGGASGDTPTSPSASQEPTPSEAPESEAPESEAPATEPAEGDVATELVTFDVPEGWIPLTPEEAMDATDPDQLAEGGREFLDETGIGAEELITLIGQSEVVAADSAGARDGFLDNLNVTHQPGGLNTREQVEGEYQNIGGTVLDFETTEIAGTPANVIAYRLEFGQLRVEGRTIQVEAGGQTAIITISAGDAGRADAALEQVRTTLRPLG